MLNQIQSACTLYPSPVINVKQKQINNTWGRRHFFHKLHHYGLRLCTYRQAISVRWIDSLIYCIVSLNYLVCVIHVICRVDINIISLITYLCSSHLKEYYEIVDEARHLSGFLQKLIYNHATKQASMFLNNPSSNCFTIDVWNINSWFSTTVDMWYFWNRFVIGTICI